MSVLKTVAKIGNGNEIFNKPFEQWLPTEGPYRPNTTSKYWRVIEERSSEFVIEVFD